MTATTARPRLRDTYRHGDLQRALIEAGVALARDGGPDAVVLREATRRAGVVPNAAYRHFASRQALLQAVRVAALQALAVAMEAELGRLRKSRRPADYARASLRAVGTGYLRFALAEPGLFRTAFAVPPAALAATRQPTAADQTPRIDPATPATYSHLGAVTAGHSGLNPFELLGAALNRLVEAGVLAPERRAQAEYLAWSAVHGLAMLVIDGPLRRLPRRQIDQIGQRLLDMVEKGL